VASVNGNETSIIMQAFNPGWMIDSARDWDHPGPESLPPFVKVQIVGPSTYDGPADRYAMPTRFRLKDADGIVYAMGWTNDDAMDGEHDPLQCYGEGQWGCASMEIRTNGDWVPFIG
jgi:hypothetical protein